jgi:hypothetical protein
MAHMDDGDSRALQGSVFRILLATCVVLSASWGVARAEGSADAPGELGKLLAMRDGLLAALEKRQSEDHKIMPQRDLWLKLEEGADRDDLWFALRHRGGKWQRCFGEAPAWCQGTMQEWRSFHLGNETNGAWRCNLRFGVDCPDLKIGDRLTGPLAVQFRIDQLLDEKLPPRPAFSWWDRFIPTGYVLPRKQSYSLDAAVAADAVLLELCLDGGVNWTTTPRGTTAPVTLRRPILVRATVPCGDSVFFSRNPTMQHSAPPPIRSNSGRP